MKIIKRIPHDRTGLFGKLFLDYVNSKAELKPFYSFNPTIDGIDAAIEDRKKKSFDRETLHRVVYQQHKKLLTENNQLHKNIELLKDNNTFTITTGHQLCFASGPLYTIYKICDIISVCKQLNDLYSTYNFVPVFWMASEDHDLAEINHIHINGKKYHWKMPSSGISGRIKLDTTATILASLTNDFHDHPNWKTILPWLTTCYSPDFSGNLADATRSFLNRFFEDYGLIILDPDVPELKKLLAPLIAKDIKNCKLDSLINSSNTALEKEGYHIQAKHRMINYFYINSDERIPIDHNSSQGIYSAGKNTWDVTSIESEVNQFPERFSPNVITRPIYQETILPNLVYCGGPGEIAYWLQLQEVFKFFELEMPVLLPRSNYLLLDQKTHSFITEKSIQIDELFIDKDQLIRKFLEHTESEYPGLSVEIKNELNRIHNSIIKEVGLIDKSLIGFAESEKAKSNKYISNMDSKIIRSLKRVHEESIQKINTIHSKLFPENSVQERYDNFIQHYIKSENNFISDIITNSDPLDFNYKVILQD